MNPLCKYLLPNERIALVEALRRDVESERSKAMHSPGWAEYHLQNARLNIRILEAFGYRLDWNTLPFQTHCADAELACQ